MRNQTLPPWHDRNVEIQRKSRDFVVPRARPGGDGANWLWSPSDSGYGYMYREDVTNEAFPYGGRVSKAHVPLIELHIDKARDNNHVALLSEWGFGFASQAYDRGDLSAVICDWARSCVNDLIVEGKVAYEVALAVNKDNRENVGFAVTPISGKLEKRFRWWGSYQQLIPNDAHDAAAYFRNEAVAMGERFVQLDPARVVEVELTGHLRAIHTANKQLVALGDLGLPDFMTPLATNDRTKKLPTDLQVYSQNQAAAIASASRDTGWWGRGSFNDYLTEYYSVARMLRMKSNIISLRATVVKAANTILGIAGDLLGFEASFHLNESIRHEDIREAEIRLGLGDRSAADLFADTSLY